MSRIQCKWVYNKNRLEFEDGKWYISDGDGDKLSTNGTWTFVEAPAKLKNNSMFKAGQLTFKVKVANDWIIC